MRARVFEQSEKFRAETFRMLGFAAGVPFGNFVLYWYLGNVVFDWVFLVRTFFAFISLWGAALLMMKSYGIMYKEDIKKIKGSI